MKCTDFENRLNELLDDRLSPQEDAALVSHAENCLDCREMLAAQESLFRGMAVLARRTPLPDLGTRVLGELNTPAAPISLPPVVRKPVRWMTLLASAAAVLVAVSVGMWIVGRNNRQPEVAQPQAKDKDRNSGLSIIKPGGSRPSPDTRPQPERVKPQSLVVTPPAPLPSPDPLQVQPQSAPQADIDGAMASLASHWQSTQSLAGRTHWTQVESINVEQYAPGIRPIRESFEVAIDALLKTIPQGKKDSRPAPPQAQYGEMLDLA